MNLFPADFSRMIDLPGVGPCARPVDVDQTITGFSDLVSMRVYVFEPGPAIDGDAEDDEVYIVLLSGAARIEVTGAQNAVFDLAEDGIRAVYLPIGHHYHLTPQARSEIAYLRAKPNGAKAPAGFASGERPHILRDPAYADRLTVQLIEVSADAPLALAASGGERLMLGLGPSTGPDGTLVAWSTLALSPADSASIAVDSPTMFLIASA